MEPATEARQSDLRRGHREVMEKTKMKLLAGMMGIGFDELIQRDKVRALSEAKRKERRAHLIAGIFAGMALLSVFLAVFAIQQRDAAATAAEAERAARENGLSTGFTARSF